MSGFYEKTQGTLGVRYPDLSIISVFVHPFEWDSDMGDLKNSSWIYLKGVLFLAILIISVALILIDCFSWKIMALLCLVAWSSARFYYFLFYVIEKYVDPTYKFSGILSFILYITGRKK